MVTYCHWDVGRFCKPIFFFKRARFQQIFLGRLLWSHLNWNSFNSAKRRKNQGQHKELKLNQNKLKTIKMKQEELSVLTDIELLVEAKKMKSAEIMSATLIGFMIGIIIFSIWKNTIGLFTLIPLYFIFRVFHNPKNNEKNKALKGVLKERGLK